MAKSKPSKVNNKGRREMPLQAVVTTILAIAVVFVFAIAIKAPSFDSASKNGVARDFNDGWYIVKENGTRENFKDFGKTIDQKEITLIHMHDDDLNSIDALGLYNYYSAVEVYAGDQMVYSYGSWDDINNHVNLGNYYSMIDIHKHDMAESEIKVIFMNNNPQTIYGFTGGSGGSLEMALVREYIITLLTPLISVVFLIVTLFIKIRKDTKDLVTPTHKWLLIFALTISVWELADSQILMDIGFDAGGVCLLSFEIFMLLPIPLLKFSYYSCRKLRKANFWVCMIVYANFIVLNILNFAHIKDFLYTLAPTMIIVGLSLLFCFAQILLEHQSKPSLNTRLLLGGYIAFAFCATIQLLQFFSDPTKSNTNSLQIGLLIFLILQFGMVIYSAMQRTNQIVKRLEDQTRFLMTKFKSFVPDDIIQQRLDKNEATTNTGEHKYLTVLESDIRGFSQLIQNMAAEDAIDMINHYFGCMTAILSRQDGLCLEFIGDAIIALFDEDRAGENHAEKAVIAAVQMQYIMKDINEWNAKKGFPSFDMGIGITTGNVYVGYIGSEERMEYDAFGSTMNLVSRIESYSTGGQILISDECMKNVSLELNIAKSFMIYPKGYKEGVEVFQVIGLGEPYNISSSTIEETPQILSQPIPITYNMIINKVIGKQAIEGTITEASRTNAMLVTSHALELYDNLRINYKDGFTCKVISKSERGILLRFTSTPPDFALQGNGDKIDNNDYNDNKER